MPIPLNGKMPSTPKSAWLIEWKWFGDHAAVSEPFIGIIDGRTSQQAMRRLIEILYLLKSSTRREQHGIAESGDLAYPAQVAKRGHVACGDNPFIVAEHMPIRIGAIWTHERIRAEAAAVGSNTAY
jgi:hypothetical protein